MAAFAFATAGCELVVAAAHARDSARRMLPWRDATPPASPDAATDRAVASAATDLGEATPGSERGVDTTVTPPARPPVGAPRSKDAIAMPQPGEELDARVMARVEAYPSDGTFAFHWPGPDWRGAWAGVTRDVHYRGETIAEADAQGRTFCCGVTFEVALATLQEAYGGPVPGLSAMEAYRMRLGFCGDDKSLPSERLAVDALVTQGLGTAIAPDDARAGDFVQFWRRDGSGHSAVFLDWLYDGRGRPRGIQYWSSQAATEGVGFHVEPFGGRRGIDRDRVYLARLHAPFDASPTRPPRD